MKTSTRKLTLSALFLALGLVLPLITGQIPQIGKMLLPMHIPVLLCGMVCGWPYGLAVGAVMPLLRGLLFGMPVLYPTGIGMAFELAAYGAVIGLLYAKLNKRGVPSYALFATVVFGLAAFLTSLIGEGKAYDWLVNISGMAGFITWIGIAICHFRFRRAYVAQGKDLKDLPYKATWFPFGPLLALIMCIIVTAGQNYSAFTGAEIDWYGASVAYIGIPVFLAVFFYHKIKHKTHLIPLKEVNLSRDK